MKEILEAFGTRIRSPFFGYFALSLFSLNWKAIFILTMSDEKINIRIAEFEKLTSVGSLVWYPIALAILIAIVYPWIQYVFLFLASKPTNLKNILQSKSEHILLIEKKKFEQERLKLLSIQEEAVIDQAKRDKIVEEIEDEDIKDTVKKKLESLREESFMDENEKLRKEKENNIKNLMEMATKYREALNNDKLLLNDRQALKRKAEELENKAHKILLEITTD